MFVLKKVFLDDQSADQGLEKCSYQISSSNSSDRPFRPTYDDGGDISDIEFVDADMDSSKTDVTSTLEEVVFDLEKLNLNKTLEPKKEC